MCRINDSTVLMHLASRAAIQLTLVISVPQKSLKNKLEMGVCGRRSLLSLMAEMSSKTNPHCNAFQ